jgi:hypothetical protein
MAALMAIDELALLVFEEVLSDDSESTPAEIDRSREARVPPVIPVKRALPLLLVCKRWQVRARARARFADD